MNANVAVEIGTFDPGTEIIEPLRPARAHILLADGVLTIANFEGVTAQGRLSGYVQLDGRGDKALYTADLRLLGVDLAHWLRLKRSGNAPPYLSGKLDALVKVKGSGRSSAEILGSLSGDVRMHMRDAAISHLAVEVGGIDVAQALGMLVKGDNALPILCNVADLDIEQGIVRPKVFVVNTRDSTIWIDGTASLRDETLDLRAVVSPKDFSPLTLRTPVRVRGTFGDPKVSLEIGKLAGKAGAAGLLGAAAAARRAHPLRRSGPGAQKEASQTDAMRRARSHQRRHPCGGEEPPVDARAPRRRAPRRLPRSRRPLCGAALSVAAPRPRAQATPLAPESGSGLALVADERAFALRMRLAFLFGAARCPPLRARRPERRHVPPARPGRSRRSRGSPCRSDGRPRSRLRPGPDPCWVSCSSRVSLQVVDGFAVRPRWPPARARRPRR